MWTKQAQPFEQPTVFNDAEHKNLISWIRAIPWPSSVNIIKIDGTHIAIENQPGMSGHQISLELGGMTPEIQLELDKLNARPARASDPSPSGAGVGSRKGSVK